MENPYQTGFAVPNFQKPPHPKGITLEGDEVLLVPLDVEAHAEELYQAYAQNPEPKDWLYLPYGPFENFDAYRAWLHSVADQNDPVFFTIINKGDARPVGVLSFLRIDQANGVIEVGHINYARALQRSTLATEAQFLLANWVFANGYRRYEWKCDALNLRSRRTANRLGFSYEGVFRQATMYKGRNRDTAWFAMIDQDWPKIREAYLTYLSKANFSADGSQIQSLSALTAPHLYKADDGLLNSN